jgi:hypothetical protein
MNVTQMISELRAERASIEEAIVVLERLVSTQPGRRGRPPAWLASVKASARHASKPTGVKRVFSAATRKKMALSQKKRWAAAKTQGQS